MQILKKIFAGWAIFVFITSLLLLFPFFLVIFQIFPKSKTTISYPVRVFWARLLLFCFGIRIKLHADNYSFEKGNYIFVSNHRSLLDIVICNAVIPLKFQFLAKKELTKIPLFGYIIRNTSLMVNRESNTSKVNSLTLLKETLKKGTSVLVFPEGTRNTTEVYLQPLRNGAFRLAEETGTPIVVITIWNTSELFTRNFHFSPGTIHIFVSDPIFPIKGEKLAEMKENAIQIFTTNIEKAVLLKGH